MLSVSVYGLAGVVTGGTFASPSGQNSLGTLYETSLYTFYRRLRALCCGSCCTGSAVSGVFHFVVSTYEARNMLCKEQPRPCVVKAMHFHRVKLGSSSAVNHTGHSWHREGLPARIAPMRRKSSTLYMACCTSLCKRECTMLESPL